MEKNSSIKKTSSQEIRKKGPFFNKGQSSDAGSFFFQPKLTVGPTDDVYEREADAVADKVVQMKADQAVLQPVITPLVIQRKCSQCKQEELQRKENEQGDEQQEAPAIVADAIAFGGTPLDNGTSRVVQMKADQAVLQPMITPLGIQRKCSQCEEEELQRKDNGQRDDQQEAPAIISSALGSSGTPLDNGTKSFMENRFGYNFSNVKIHTDDVAAKSAQSINALAYTSGNSIVFNQGQYSPDTTAGKKLLAHELTHVVQQNSAGNTIQRTVNGSNTPRTPTNCHNWKIPLPPWIAGIYAHSQIARFTAGAGIIPHLMPRATKILRGIPSPPFGTPPGFADLWWNTGMDVKVAEIKSTAAGDAAARPEAAHYRNRHNEWLMRLGIPPVQIDDSAYLASVGAPIPGGLLDLSGFTGTGISLGPFSGDPLKQLHMEADSTGAVVYWCTGVGLINPAWAVVLQRLLDRLRQFLEEMKRLAQQIGQGLQTAFEWLGENAPMILAILLIIAFIALIVVAIICALGAGATFGISAVCSYLSVIVAIEVAASILLLLGISGGDEVRQAGTELARAVSSPEESAQMATAEDYERGTGTSLIGSVGSGTGAAPTQADPASRLAAALNPLLSMDSMLAVFRASANPPAASHATLNRALAILDTADPGTASIIRSGMGTA